MKRTPSPQEEFKAAAADAAAAQFHAIHERLRELHKELMGMRYELDAYEGEYPSARGPSRNIDRAIQELHEAACDVRVPEGEATFLARKLRGEPSLVEMTMKKARSAGFNSISAYAKHLAEARERD